MVARRLFALGSFVTTLAALSGCEPSLMGDYGGRNNANVNGVSANSSSSSGGNNMWTSPRWTANNPQAVQPPQNLAQNPTQLPAAQNGAVQQGGAPWSNTAQNATVQQDSSTVTPVANGAQPQQAVCEDNRPRALEMPGDSCARPCRAAWQQCFDRCNNGQDRGCVATCDDAYRECMRGCY
jgi:hypothetical protein